MALTYQRANASPSVTSLGGIWPLYSVCVAIAVLSGLWPTLDLSMVQLPCWVEIDLDAIAANVRAIHAAANPRRGITAVVKAQAYGLGANAVAQAALEAGASGLAVARVSEGKLLRKGGLVHAPILLMGGPTPDECEEIVQLDLTPTITDWATAQRLAEAAGRAGTVLGVQVKVDTG